MSFGVEAFKATKLGQRVGSIIENDQNISDMIAFSRHGMPAVQVIGKALRALGPEVRGRYAKQSIGRWVKEVLAKHGWKPRKSGRVSPGNLFSRGMIYQEIH